MKDQYFVSLGAGNHQLPLILAAKSIGYSVIAIDQSSQAVGFDLAEKRIVNSILDRKSIIQSLQSLNESNQIRGMYSRSFGKAVEVAHSVGNYFNLPSNLHTSLRMYRNKIKYKHIFQSWQIPVPADIENANRFIIRPASGFAKEGLQIVSRSQVEQLRQDFKNSNSQNTLIEPFIEEGRECILLAFVIDGSFFPLVITDRIRNPDFSDRMHIYPSILPPEVRYQIVEHCRRIVRRSKIMQGPFLAEFIITDDNKPYLVECAPEVGGEFLADDLVPAVLNLPYFELLIHIYTRTNLIWVKNQLMAHLEEPKSTSMVIGFSSAVNTTPTSLHSQFSTRIYAHHGFYFARHLPVVCNSRPNSMRSKVIALTGPIEERQNLIDSVEEFIELK